MQTFSLGKVAVTTAGTRVNLKDVLPAGFPTDHKCARIVVSQVVGATGAVVFGTTAVVASSLVGAIKQFAPAAASGLTDTYIHDDNTRTGNPLHVDDFALDVAVNSEGLIVSIEVR
jgi:hypothetical protein